MNEDSRPAPKIQIVIEQGELADVRVPVGTEPDIEVIHVDYRRVDYGRMLERRREIYEDGSMRSASFRDG